MSHIGQPIGELERGVQLKGCSQHSRVAFQLFGQAVTVEPGGQWVCSEALKG